MSTLEALRADLDACAGASFDLEVGVLRLHHLDYGGDLPALVILPGITSPAITWDFVAEALSNFTRVIVPDLRGRGLSESPATGYALSDYAADLTGQLAQLEIDRAIVVGHSMGARIAAAFAVAQPDSVVHSVLLDPPLSGPTRPYPTSLEAFKAQLDGGRGGTTAEAVAAFYPQWPRRELELRARWLDTCADHAVIESHHYFEVELFEPLWRDLGAAATLVYGGASPVVLSSDIPALRVANPDAALLEVEGAGHMIPWDRPAQSIALLRALVHPLALAEERTST